MRTYWKVTATYLGFGVLWILLTGIFSLEHSPDVYALALFEMAKGWLYVAISAVLIFFLTRRAFNAQLRANEEKLRVFKTTVGGAHHILLNYLNQMQVVTMEADKFPAFDREILEIAEQVSLEAETALRKLIEIEAVTPASIDDAVYGEIRRPQR